MTPRRGQSAYDRRDNLVLACKACNGIKADMPVLAFLLRDRRRAEHMARHGGHLSGMLRKMIGELAGMEVLPISHDTKPPKRRTGGPDPLSKAIAAVIDGFWVEESPYAD